MRVTHHAHVGHHRILMLYFISQRFLHEIALMSSWMIVQDTKDAIAMLLIKWPCLETIGFQPGMMAITFAGLILSNAQKPTAKSLMPSIFRNRKSIEVHPATCENNIDAPKETILLIADKYS